MFEIIVDKQSYKFHSKGTSTGMIYLKIENQFFPDPVWNDFPEVIIAWWLEGFTQLLSYKDQGYYEFLFMDGPCKWVIDYEGNENVKIKCYRHDKIEINSEEKLGTILEMLLSETNDFLRFCHENNFENDDLRTLKNNFQKLLLQRKERN